jgi:hypothetical protein
MNEKILKIPYHVFKEDWDLLQKFLKIIGNPRYVIDGNVDLSNRHDIFDLGNLVGVEGSLFLYKSSIESLGELEYINGALWMYECDNIESLGKLQFVMGDLNIGASWIKSLGKLKFVGGMFILTYVNIPMTELDNVEVIGRIYK